MEEGFSLGPLKRILLLGGDELLIQLAVHCHSIGLQTDIITSPRHAQERFSDGKTMEEHCKNEKFRFLITEDITSPDVCAFVGDMEDTAALSIGAAWIFQPEIIEKLFGNKLLNTHGTRLPRDRGGGGFSWPILRGDRLGHCLLHLVDGGIDTGPILATKEFLFPASCRLPKDYQQFHREKNLTFIAGMLSSMHEGKVTLPLIRQSEHCSTYNPRLHTAISGWIDWGWEAPELERFICAFDEPYVGASTRLRDRVVRLHNVFLQQTEGHRHPFEAGLVYRIHDDWIMVAARGGDLIVSDVRDENGTSIRNAIQPGDRFVTLPEDLARARQRIVYDAKGLKK